MCYDFWNQDSQLSGALGPSSSQPQQNYPPSAPANSYEDYPMSNNQVPAPADLHDAEFSQSNGLFPSNMTHPFLENDQHDIHSATGQPLHNAFFNDLHPPSSGDPSANNMGFPGTNLSEPCPIEVHPYPVHDNQSESHMWDRLHICRWNNGHGSCDESGNEGEIVDHVSCHLTGRASDLVKCQWDRCKRLEPFRRDTIIRHIREVHLKIRPRRKSWLASPSCIVASLRRRSRQNPQPY